jgi:lipoprotein-releasing system permease protein
MYKLLLCVRYLRTRYIALASIISVMLGVATMIVVNSVMAGFTSEMRDRIHGFLADVVIESRTKEGMEDSEGQLQVIQDAVGDYVAAATATVEMPGVISFGINGETFTQTVTLVGIEPSGKADVSPLQDYLASYHELTEGRKTWPAERSVDEPVGWTLTPSAAEWRRVIKEGEERRLRDKGMLEPSETISQAPSEDGATNSLQAPVFEDAALPDSGTGSPFNLADPDPFGDIDSFNSKGGGVRKEPQEARVYIGEGIIGYNVRDQKTGELRKVMMVRPGDDVTLTTIMTGVPPKPTSFEATICDVFRSGMSEYDSQLVFMNLEQLQQNRGMLLRDPVTGEIVTDAITSIQIKLKDYADADLVVEKLKAAFLPGMVTVRTWESRQELLLSAVEMETAILNLLLFLIIAVAGFGILAIFYMIVVEKTRDIGILKSLGASSRGIMSIFLSYGLGLGMVGSLAGLTIGLLFVHYINEIEGWLSWATGRKVFPRDIYYFSSIPTHVEPMMVFWVAMGAMGIAVLASVLPARRASRLHPVRALRFD